MKSIKFVKHICGLIAKNISFVVLMVSVLVALSLIVGVAFGTLYSNAENNALTIGNMIVKQEAQRIDDALAQGLNTLQMAGLSVDYMLDNGMSEIEVENYLIEETKKTKEDIDASFSGIYGVINGVYIDGTLWEPDEEYDPYTRPWYTAAKNNGNKPTIVSPYIDAQTGHRMISFSQILNGGVNALSLDKEIDDIYDAARDIQLYGKGYCFVIDNLGLVVSHHDDDEKDKNYLKEDSENRLLLKKVFAANGNETECMLNGEKCFVFSAKMQDNWFVVLVVKSSDVFSDISSSLTKSILISLVIFLIVGYFCTSNYINRKKALKFANEVRTDNLTGLNNRGEFDRFISATINGIPEDKKLYLMLIDADNFKSINDIYGHIEGDKALVYIADVLKDVSIKSESFCARYGGDEFVFISKCARFEDVSAIIDEIKNGLQNAIVENKLPYKLDVSIGIAAHSKGEQTITELIDNADSALYEEKRSKRSCRENN